MFAPTRLFLALRHDSAVGLIFAASAVTVLFAATPFVIPEVADEFDVSVGRAGLLSAAQVGGFAVSAFVAGRRLRTHRRYLVGGAFTAVIGNLLSAVAPTFEVLVGLRVLTGVAGGLLVWLAWADAMRDSGALRSVAAVGPLTALVAAPLFAQVAELGGSDAIFAVIAVAFVPPALLRTDIVSFRKERKRRSPSKSNVVLIVALGVNTLAGSALFVFGAVIGESLDIPAVVVSLGYSLNALAGFIAARWSPGGRYAGAWIFGTALSAAAVAFGGPVLFMVGLTAWGFCFWMATLPLLASIAEWSLAPDERVGDAQSSMAVGRAIGPAVGSVLVGDAMFDAIGVFAVGGLALAGSITVGVALYRRSHDPPAGAVGVATA